MRSDSLGGVSDHVRPPVGHGGSRIARDAGRHAAAGGGGREGGQVLATFNTGDGRVAS